MSALLLDAALKGTALLVVACVLAVALRRAGAARRHLLWALALAGLLVLPVLGLLLPRWQLPLTSPWAGETETRAVPAAPEAPRQRGGGFLVPHARLVLEAPVQRPATPLLVASREHELPREARPGEAPAPPNQDEGRPGTPPGGVAWLLVLWAAGVALALAWLAAGFLSVWLLRRGSRLVSTGPLVSLLRELAEELGIRRRVRLLLSERRAIPMTWGVLRPVVLLPAEAEDWPAERLRVVLLHELGHVLRWDCLTQLVAHLARALYWFHPLAWLAVARLRVEQEAACDDVVLATGAGPADYAEHLLAVTAQLPADFFAPPVALAVSRADRLRRRLTAVLEPDRPRGPVGRRGLVLAAGLSAGLLLPLGAAGWEPVSAGQQGKTIPGQEQKKPPEAPPNPLKAFEEVRTRLLKHYVKPLDDRKLTEDAIRGMLKSLQDPYSEYLDPEELRQMERSLKATLTGIGVQLRKTEGRPVVVSPLEGSPALKAGLRPGDEIEAIDGKPAAGLEMAEVVKRILGPRGKVVKLRVVHPDGVVQDMAIPRGQIRVPSVEGFLRDADGHWQFLLNKPHKVGYIRVLYFSGKTAEEVREALATLKKAGMKGLILDLRSCPGGLLQQAIGVCKLLLDKGPIVTIRGPNREEQKFESDGTDFEGDFPLVVLLNGQTASSAEIVAGSLRDRKRAVLIGSRSYGKGSVSAIFNLDGGGALKLTTAYYYLPSGRNLHKRAGEKAWGVDPTEGDYLPLTTAQQEAQVQAAGRRTALGMKKGEEPKWTEPITPKVLAEEHADPQLAAALRTMVARLTGGEFIKVGRPGAGADQGVRLDELRGRREELLKSLRQVERDLGELEGGAAKEPKR
jgi:carboxyl-terminal processing protease